MLESWSGFCKKVVKSLQFHIAKRSRTQKHTSLVPCISEQLPRPSDASAEVVGLCAAQLDSQVGLRPKLGFPEGSCRMSCSTEGLVWWQQTAFSCCFCGEALFHHMAVHAPIHLISVGRIKLSPTEYRQKTQRNVVKNIILQYPGKGMI